MRDRRGRVLVAVMIVAVGLPATAGAQSPPTVPLSTPPVRDTEPVVLTGASFASWAAPADVPVAAPSLEGLQCLGEDNGVPAGQLGDSPATDDEPCTHNSFDEPLASTQAVGGAEGVPVDRLLAYRWDGDGFTQVPFQVDEMFTRHLSNNASGFAAFSERDRHDSYVFDREGFRWTASDPSDPCLAAPASEVAVDPVPGLDTDDELVFMARDAGSRAPADAPLPGGVEESFEVAVIDPVAPSTPGYVYVARAAEDGPAPAFDASTGYVRYERDADADVFLFSESSYEDYGNAPDGPWYDPATGTCHADEADWRQHRPGDQATVTTPRYRFRYEGRWLMTELQVSSAPDGDWQYGDDLVDQWKARAFQQRPGGETPCCGFEEEVNNWGGSSILLGEKAGPVRVIRETWGADSATNLVRREVFYRDEIRQTAFLRVHVIPPLDGIYVQWDHAATAVDTYYNPFNPEGVPIDGRNDELMGNAELALSESGVRYDGDDELTATLDELVGTPIEIGDPDADCQLECLRNDVDLPDPTFSGPNALLAWEQVDGPAGTLVTRWSSTDITPGGAAHSLVAVPYYRDDACFDDGTGSDPGPHLDGRSTDDGEDATWVDGNGDTQQRECWDVDRHRTDDDYAADLGTRRFFQGSVGTHGLHLLLVADSDNAFTTAPVTELNAEQRMVVLPPQGANVGEAYGRGFEVPLVTTAVPFAGGDGEPGGGDEDPVATELRWDGDTTHGPRGATELAAVLTDDDGVPIEGRAVTFAVDGASHEATTGADGRAAVTTELRNGADHQVTVAHAGDESHAASSTQAQVRWDPSASRGPRADAGGLAPTDATAPGGRVEAAARVAAPFDPGRAPMALLAIVVMAAAAVAQRRLRISHRSGKTGWNSVERR